MVVVVVAVVVTSGRVQFWCRDAGSVRRTHQLRDPVLTWAVLFREWTGLSTDDVSATPGRSRHFATCIIVQVSSMSCESFILVCT